MSRTYLALLHFDGRAFAGWQRQPRSRTVQAEVEAVLERLNGRRIVAHGAGRTDAGVHARGLGVSFTVPARWSAPDLHRALNALLPQDCWIERLTPMQPGFHARRSATGRQYRYDIGTDAASESPFRRPYEWALGRPLELPRMQQAATLLPGRHHFQAFAVRKPEADYHCTLRLARWERRADHAGLSFQVAADRFLHHMVRFLVGTMVDIGLGRRPVEDMATLLASHDNQATSPPAPPQGLYFMTAEYPAACYADPAPEAAP